LRGKGREGEATLKVSIILGTRPQIIKSAPVYDAFRKAGVECDIVNTGQHFDFEMNRQFFSELRLPDPSADLNVGSGTPVEQVAAIIGGLGVLFAKQKPDVAVVPGDTNSALAAGIACVKAGVPVAHLESGCRSGDLRMAEEVNRRVLDHMAQVLLCPTPGCVKNVVAERVLAGSISHVGDTMYDSLKRLRRSIDAQAEVPGLPEGEYAFMTLHRAETVDDPRALREVLRGVGSLGMPVAFSVHPRTRARMREFGVELSAGMKAVEPLPYLQTLRLVRRSRFVITDSGGLQKEAYWLGKPSLILRDSTEWQEIVDAGAAFLVGTSRDRIKRASRQLEGVTARSFAGSGRIFGSGNASSKVVRVVSTYSARSGREGR
jgi:UDP-N-acetylglucosamine 2-epimerase